MIEITRRKIIGGISVLGLAAFVAVQPCLADWDYRTVEGAGGVPLNVVTAGDPGSPAILFIHGIGQSHYSFVRQLDSELADDFYLVAFDLRGHGVSGKPWVTEAYTEPAVWAQDVAAVMAATRLKRPLVVAWSYGTLVMMDYVREFGVEGLAGIVLTGALGALKPFRMPQADDPNAEEFARLRELQVSPDPIDNIRASERMVAWLTAEPLPERERELFQEIGLMLPAYARRAMVKRTFDNQDLLERLALPVLLSLGEEDNPMQLEDGVDIAAGLSNVTLSVYEGTGHTVFFERPHRFNAELRRFAEQTLSSGSPPAE